MRVNAFSRVWVTAGAIFLCLGPFGAEVHATSPQRAEQLRKVEELHAQGAAFFRARKYRRAIAKFEEGYAIYPEPNLLYNIARAHEALGQIDFAIDNYKRCSLAPDVDEEIAQRARDQAEKLSKARLRSAVTPESASSEPAVARQPEQAPAGETPTAVSTPTEEPSSWMSTTKWIVGGVGLGVLVGGAALLLMGQSDHSEIDDAKSADGGVVSSMTQVKAQDKLDSGNFKKAISYGLFGVGAAAVITSAVFFVLDGQKESASQPSRPIDVAFAPIRSGAALSLSGSF